jgi:Fe2+ transport system protein B
MSRANNEFNWKDSVSLKEYVERMASEMCRSNDLRFTAQDKALELARETIERRLESMNEFRSQLKDQAATFMTSAVYEAKHELLQKQVDDMRITNARLEGKADQKSVTLAYIFSLVGIVLGILGLIESWTH